jgi:polysaccharide export outer membrane protein
MKQIKSGILHLFFVALLLVQGACTSTVKSADIPAATAAAAPPPVPMAKDLPSYRIQIGDELLIKMLVNPELDEDVVVQPDGMISTAVVQNMKAYGKTTKELQNNLIQAYKTQLIHPQLNVVVKSFAPTKIYVLGQVASPGEMISAGPNMTVLQALSRAGGLLNSADEKNILIMRRGTEGKDDIYRVDYDAATNGGDRSKDVQLAAYDVVFVPRTGVANVYKSFQQNFQQFLPGSLGLSIP